MAWILWYLGCLYWFILFRVSTRKCPILSLTDWGFGVEPPSSRFLCSYCWLLDQGYFGKNDGKALYIKSECFWNPPSNCLLGFQVRVWECDLKNPYSIFSSEIIHSSPCTNISHCATSRKLLFLCALRYFSFFYLSCFSVNSMCFIRLGLTSIIKLTVLNM